MPSRRQILRRLEYGAVAVAVFAVHAWASRYWIDLTDEGYFLSLAARVYRGELPYRDFETYYTPGIFYLYAAVFKLFGVGVVPIRMVMAVVRAACALLLYRLGRRVAPAPFAILPPLAVAAVDAVPIYPEPHPGWWGLLATLLALEAIVSHAAGGRLRWVALAGAAASAAFLFKQNVGAFAVLAVGGYLLLRRREHVGRSVLVVQGLFATAVGLAATWLLWPALDGLVAAAIWLPLLTTLTLVLRQAWGGVRPAGWTAGLGPIALEAAVAGGTFVGVTLLWLVPLVLALGPSQTPFGLFAGATVNQGALTLTLEPPPRAARELAWVAIWLPLAVGLLLRGPVTGPARRLVAAGLGASLLVSWIPIAAQPREPLFEDPTFYPWLDRLEEAFGTLYLYLPALGAWAGLAALLVGARRGAPAGPLPWYLLVGTLAALAMYPRTDAVHAMFAGPPLFVVGAWALARIHRRVAGAAGPARQVAVFASLLVLPLAAAAPHVYWRYVTIVHADPRSPEPPPYVPLGLERAAVLAPRHVADNLRGAVELVRSGTPPGDALFAYPAAPLFNFLADRPNPTRFDHFFPGALTPDELADVVGDLEAARPRYVVWDHGGAFYWGTDPANRPLSDYIWRCYRQVASFPPFLVLERQEC